MFCSHCNDAVSDSDLFCPHCGHFIVRTFVPNKLQMRIPLWLMIVLGTTSLLLVLSGLILSILSSDWGGLTFSGFGIFLFICMIFIRSRQQSLTFQEQGVTVIWKTFNNNLSLFIPLDYLLEVAIVPFTQGYYELFLYTSAKKYTLATLHTPSDQTLMTYLTNYCNHLHIPLTHALQKNTQQHTHYAAEAQSRYNHFTQSAPTYFPVILKQPLLPNLILFFITIIGVVWSIRTAAYPFALGCFLTPILIIIIISLTYEWDKKVILKECTLVVRTRKKIQLQLSYKSITHLDLHSVQNSKSQTIYLTLYQGTKRIDRGAITFNSASKSRIKLISQVILKQNPRVTVSSSLSRYIGYH